MTRSSRHLVDRVRLLLLPCLLLLAHGPAAAAGWSELRQGNLKGAFFGDASGEGVFLLACDAPNDVLLQANIPEGAKVKAGKPARLAFSVDGRRFTYSGKVMEADGEKSQVLMASAKVSDPLVKALAEGKSLTISKGRASYELPLEGSTAAIASFVAACGGTARAPAAAAEAATPAAAQPATHRAAAGAIPPASEIAAAIFVDKKEGKRVAGKLKITPLDLNGDGADEAIITVKDPGWCSENGCTIFVVAFSGGTPRTIGEFIGNSLSPARSSTGEWRDLTLVAPGGSEIENYVDGNYR